MLCSGHELLERRWLSVVIVRPAEDLANLSNRESSLGRSLQKERRDFHVAETDRPDLEVLLNERHVSIYVDCLDVVVGSHRDWLLDMVPGHPREVVGADLHRIR